MRKPDNLVDALAKKTAELPEPDAAAPPRQSSPPSRRGTKAMTVHVDPAVSKAMRTIALENDTSLQKLLLEAVNDCLVKHGKPPIA